MRCVEIRGNAEQLRDQPARTSTRISAEIIRIHPDRIISFGLDTPEVPGAR